jgi:hypothetical protein
MADEAASGGHHLHGISLNRTLSPKMDQEKSGRRLVVPTRVSRFTDFRSLGLD